ncbi:hypothetical protein F8154_05280 [Alkaliphilus pronyensis]|uniref:SPOR domain-containing protein n=1 Tax=Alkaliphilus pronyensis TaxID=1482732 RepID=A0A6I0F7E6_9FIRM|nr:hypothetical protein [Alkaliphilus pronyensis]KAB3535929.1 hypothetical protein F8154_05280 [Alkaliphilus pronyensis]
MKKSRLKINRRRRKSNLVLVFFLCIILPITAIYIGLRVTERWITPVLNSELQPEDSYELDLEEIIDDEGEATDNNEATDNSNIEEEGKGVESEVLVGEIKPLSVFTIQIASITNKDNLDSLINALNQKKFSYLVYQIEETYKVYTHGYTQRPYVEDKLDTVREVFNDAYINELHLPIKEVKYENDSNNEIAEGTIENMNKLIDVMEKQTEAWYNYYEKEGEIVVYIELLKKQQTILNDIMSAIKDHQLPTGFIDNSSIEKMVHYQESNINKSMEIIENQDKENFHRLHSLYLDSLFRTIEVIK